MFLLKIRVAKTAANKNVYASCEFSVYLKFRFYISFWHVGQDAAPRAAAVINTGRWQQF